MTKLFQVAAPEEPEEEEYFRKAKRTLSTAEKPAARQTNVLSPVGLSMGRADSWIDAERQAAMFHAWLLDEDLAWLADALGLVVNLNNLPRTIAARKRNHDHANVEIHSVRTAMKRGALGWPEQHMVVVVTQWRAGFFDKVKQAAMDRQPGAFDLRDRDFKYRAGCTLLIDPEQMKIRRVIRTPGTVADEGELDLMRRYLLEGLSPPNAFAGVDERFLASAEPFAFLHTHGGA